MLLTSVCYIPNLIAIYQNLYLNHHFSLTQLVIDKQKPIRLVISMTIY